MQININIVTLRIELVTPYQTFDINYWIDHLPTLIVDNFLMFSCYKI